MTFRLLFNLCCGNCGACGEGNHSETCLVLSYFLSIGDLKLALAFFTIVAKLSALKSFELTALKISILEKYSRPSNQTLSVRVPEE